MPTAEPLNSTPAGQRQAYAYSAWSWRRQFAKSEATSRDAGKPTETLALNGLMTQALSEASLSEDGKALSKASGAPESAGTRGQNGTEQDALWAAIAPCWNRLADRDTLPATLKVSFSPAGTLAVPPEIEREPGKPITPQSLQSEGKAIAALAECGAYSMAQGRQDVVIAFPMVN